MSLIPRGTPIAVVASCGAYEPVRLARGLEIARAAGHDLHPFPGMLEPERYLAASDERRLEHLIEALSNPRWGAVWIARGGYGITRLIDRLPLEQLGRKPVIGFSDVTALHTALVQAGLGPSIHGPVVHSLSGTDDASLDHLWDLLAGVPTEPLRGRTWAPGSASGPLVGGNLTMVAATAGTSYQLDARGAILVLEDIGEVAFRIDRVLQHMASSGILDEVVGVALGEFSQCKVPEGVDWTIRDVLMDHLDRLAVPVVGELPIGHGAANRAFVYGARAHVGDGVLAWDP